MTTVRGYTPEELLDTADELLSRPDAKAAGIWPLAAAHLCRQALESLLDRHWEARLPGMERVSMRAQLACLPTYLEPPELAGRLAYTWSALSTACHHRAYELPPTASELRLWAETIRTLAAKVAARP